MPAAWRPGVNYVPGAFQVVSPLLGRQGAPEVGDGHRGDGIALLGHQLQLHASVRPYKEHLTVLVVPLEHSGQGHRGIDMSGGSAAGQKQFHLRLSPFTLIVSLGLCFKLPQPGKEASQSSRRSVRNQYHLFSAAACTRTEPLLGPQTCACSQCAASGRNVTVAKKLCFFQLVLPRPCSGDLPGYA